MRDDSEREQDEREREREQEIAALRERLRHLGNAVAAIADFLIVMGPDGRFVRVTPEVRDVLGYEPEELTGRAPPDITHAADLPTGYERLASARSQPGPHKTDFIWRLRHKRGGWRYVSVVLLDMADEPMFGGIVALLRDVTGRVVAERELAARGALLASAHHLANLGSWRFESEPGRFECLGELLRLHGAGEHRSGAFLTLTPDEVRARLCAHVVAEDRDRVTAFFLPSARDDVSADLSISYRIDAPERGRRFFSGRRQAWPTFAGAGAGAGERPCASVLGTVQDVTEQHLRELRLREREELLSIAQQLANTGSWCVDLLTGGIEWSDQLYRIHGEDPSRGRRTPQELSTCNVHPDDEELVRDAIAQVMETGVSPPLEYRLRLTDDDGEAQLRHVYASPSQTLRNEHGTPVRVIGTVQDVSARKRSERQRERLLSELADKNAELERFTYTASHDLKSPLLTIQGFVGFIGRDLDAGELGRARADLKRVERATETMRQQLDALLELSRVGKIAGDRVPVALKPLVDEVIDQLRGVTDGATRFEVPDTLPIVRGDRLRIAAVLYNLLDNACKFMGPQLRPRVRIAATYVDGRAWVRCEVHDNGVGIEPRFHERVFDLFERLSPEDGGAGTGIGLALARRIVDVHGGRLWVESAGAGAGSTFIFTLPAEPGAEVRT